MRPLLVLATVVLAGLLVAPGRAWADDQVLSTVPADGADLMTAPSTVDLGFSAVPDPDQSHVSVRDTANRDVGSGAVVATGHGLTVPVRITTSGVYTVAYHVVFADGGEALGVLRFSVGTGTPPPAADAAQRLAAQAVVSQHDHGVDPVSGTLLVVDVVVLVAVGLLLMRRPSGVAQPQHQKPGEDRAGGPGGEHTEA